MSTSAVIWRAVISAWLFPDVPEQPEPPAFAPSGLSDEKGAREWLDQSAAEAGRMWERRQRALRGGAR